MDTEMEPQPKTKNRLRNFLENVFYIVVAIVLAIVVQTFIIRPFIVNGSSMDPTFKSGDYLIVDEVSYYFHTPNRGDVVVFKAPPEPNKYYIKRVIGLPGDTVHIEGTKVRITNAANPEGFILDDSFITHPQSDNRSFVVLADSYFVMGDNRSGSYDSRAWGDVPKANIRGRALLRLLPLNHISIVPGKESL